ncbi:hypothetical protein AX16_002503 [Volvariella volvacea WC 439]|nr:hypothetical protein AX16_002503 [Volvariella volvacea WC 439]
MDSNNKDAMKDIEELPDDVLLYLFPHCMTESWTVPPSIADPRIILPQVSRKWRQLLHDRCPDIWTRFSMSSPGPSYHFKANFDNWVNRAQSLPLTFACRGVTITNQPWLQRAAHKTYPGRGLHPLGDILIPYASRFGALNLAISPSIAEGIFLSNNLAFPLLDSLNLLVLGFPREPPGRSFDPNHIPEYFRAAANQPVYPKLQRVTWVLRNPGHRLTGGYPACQNPLSSVSSKIPWTQLTHLDIFGPERGALKLIELCKDSLQQLSVGVIYFIQDTPSDNVLHFPQRFALSRLKSLTLCRHHNQSSPSSLTNFLDSIVTPKLVSICVDGTCPFEAIQRLFERSSCNITTLCIPNPCTDSPDGAYEGGMLGRVLQLPHASSLERLKVAAFPGTRLSSDLLQCLSTTEITPSLKYLEFDFLMSKMQEIKGQSGYLEQIFSVVGGRNSIIRASQSTDSPCPSRSFTPLRSLLIRSSPSLHAQIRLVFRSLEPKTDLKELMIVDLIELPVA